MNISEIIEAAKFKITEGSDFLWNCFGPDVRSLDFSSDEGNSCVVCVFNTKTQKVYEVDIYSSNDQCYRWIDEEFIDAVKNEFSERNLDFTMATDEVKWVELDVVEDVFRKTTQIIETGICDNEVSILVDIDNDTLLKLTLAAHKKNITLNELIVEILNDFMTKRKNDSSS